MNKILVYLLMLCILLTTVIAAPPQDIIIIEGESTGLQISYPPISTHPIGTDLDFHFHVFNSTGYPVDNSTTDCLFHLYDNEGHHLIEMMDVPFDDNGVDWEVEIGAGNFSYSGEYAFIMQCQNGEAGFKETNFFVSDNLNSNDFSAISFFIGIGILSFLILFLYNTLDKEHWLFKLFLMIIFPLTLLMMGSVGLNFGAGTIYEGAAKAMYTFAIWFMRIFYTYLLVSFLYQAMKSMKVKRENGE